VPQRTNWLPIARPETVLGSASTNLMILNANFFVLAFRSSLFNAYSYFGKMFGNRKSAIANRLTHSHLSAIIGSTLVARRAGTKHAARASPADITEMKAKVSKSVALTPYNSVTISLVKAAAEMRPMPIQGSRFLVFGF
jgi:hypothetical protein